jgi:hypothetical protein
LSRIAGELPPLSLEREDLGVPGAQRANGILTVMLRTGSDDHGLIVNRNYIYVIRDVTRFGID